MTILCESCNQEIRTGDRVTFFGSGIFKSIPSRVTYAFKSMNIELDSLAHFKCPPIFDEVG